MSRRVLQAWFQDCRFSLVDKCLSPSGQCPDPWSLLRSLSHSRNYGSVAPIKESRDESKNKRGGAYDSGVLNRVAHDPRVLSRVTGVLATRSLCTSSHPCAQQPSTSSEPANDRNASESSNVVPPVVPSSFLDRNFPSSVVPYLKLIRFDAPTGTALLAWPSFWSIALAAPHGQLPDLKMLALFGTGALLLRGAGCTVNDMWDRKLDQQVERTKSRPIASGQISPFQALVFLGGQLSLGLGILLQLNPYSQLLGASSLLFVGAYPAMKRITNWPQAFLGLTINWGALLGWAAVHGSCDWSVVAPLYAGGFCWTMVYDTIYAHQDKKDDIKAGIKSTALRMADSTPVYLTGFTAGATATLALAGLNAGVAWPYYASVAAMGSHLLWQVQSVNLDNPKDCGDKFRSNMYLGALPFVGAAMSAALLY